ncbi:MAG: DUF4430 domain-containing protein, partial [Acinetobacter pseudolwoffii]|nr:DUF4430 domain-containing protein [Acinetobacter pseudolwoffii]
SIINYTIDRIFHILSGKEASILSKIQNSQTKSNKTMIITAILLFAAVISAYMVFSFAGPSTTEGEKSVTIQVLDDKKNLTSYEINTDAEYLRQAMEQCQGLTFIGSEGPYGLVLLTINGLTADYDKNQAWWSIYVNDALGNYGVDQQPVNDGDTFCLQYTTEEDLAD